MESEMQHRHYETQAVAVDPTWQVCCRLLQHRWFHEIMESEMQHRHYQRQVVVMV